MVVILYCIYYVLKGINPCFLGFEHSMYKCNYLYTVFTIFY